MIFPIPKVGYLSFLEGYCLSIIGSSPKNIMVTSYRIPKKTSKETPPGFWRCCLQCQEDNNTRIILHQVFRLKWHVQKKNTQTHLVFSKISHLILKVSSSIYKRHMKPMSKSRPPITSSASQEAHFLDWAGGKPDTLHVESRFALNDVLYNLNGQSWKTVEPGASRLRVPNFCRVFEEYCQTKIRIQGLLWWWKKTTKRQSSTWFSHHSLLHLYLLDQVQRIKQKKLMQLGMHIVDHDPSKRPSDDLAFQTSTSSPQEIGEADL